MAITNTFKNSPFKAGTTDTFCYSCPSGASAVMQSMYITNKSAQSVTATVKIDNPTRNDPVVIAGNIPLPVGSVFYLDRPLTLMPRDVIQIQASSANACEGIVSVMEMT